MTTYTQTSPTGAGPLPGGVTAVGGIVVDIIGISGVRIVAQVAASDLFVGQFDYNDPDFNVPATFGTLSSLTPQMIAALGGGIEKFAARFTILDADTGEGQFDYGDNLLMINGQVANGLSNIATETTDETGATLIASQYGFGDETLDTGWVLILNDGQLASLHASLVSTGRLEFQILDEDPADNHYDFTQGVDGAFLDVITPPPPVNPPNLIQGGKAADTLTGTSGNDEIRAKAGDDTINGGAGDDFITGDAGNDHITAGKGNDRVDGGSGDDLIYGREGNDLLMGGIGNDRIIGDAGNDTLHGQAGDDVLAGGSGADVFVFGINDGNDTITDFTAGDDRISLAGTGLSFELVTLTTGATDTLITLFGTTTILLKGTTSVSEADFIF